MFIFLTTLLGLGLYLLTLSQWKKSVTVKVDSIAFNGKIAQGWRALDI